MKYLFNVSLLLQRQDNLTATMDVDEYLNYSECRLINFRKTNTFVLEYHSRELARLCFHTCTLMTMKHCTICAILAFLTLPDILTSSARATDL